MSGDNPWEPFINQSLVGSGTVDKAAIFSVDGKTVCAISKDFNISEHEMKVIVDSFTDKGDENGLKEVQKNGVKVADEKYVVLRADENSLYARKPKTGIVIAKTTSTIIVAHYPDGVQPGACTKTVEDLAEYMRGNKS